MEKLQREIVLTIKKTEKLKLEQKIMSLQTSLRHKKKIRESAQEDLSSLDREIKSIVCELNNDIDQYSEFE